MIHNVANFIRSSPQKCGFFERISRENDEAQKYLLAESPLFAASTILHPSLGKSYLEVNRASEEQVVWARDAKDGLSDYLDRWYRCNRSVNEQRGAIVKTTASPSVPQRTPVNSMLKQ
uniref:Uncharacterized protein n=1 Tax=Fusarium oxysporum (strain Fo5176) TaxID=660025 RepID=A0A0D2YDU5_FUSOF